MSVKKCKECGNQVSTKAKKCPHCGAKAPKRTSVLVWILAGVVGLLFYMSGQGHFEGSRVKAETSLSPEKIAAIKMEAKRRAQESFEMDQIYDAKKAVRNSLKDSGSAQFKSVFFNQTKKGGAVVCGQINSKNSFGAFTGFQRFISDGKTTFIEEKASNIAHIWTEVCLPDKA